MSALDAEYLSFREVGSLVYSDGKHKTQYHYSSGWHRERKIAGAVIAVFLLIAVFCLAYSSYGSPLFIASLCIGIFALLLALAVARFFNFKFTITYDATAIINSYNESDEKIEKKFKEDFHRDYYYFPDLESFYDGCRKAFIALGVQEPPLSELISSIKKKKGNQWGPEGNVPGRERIIAAYKEQREAALISHLAKLTPDAPRSLLKYCHQGAYYFILGAKGYLPPLTNYQWTRTSDQMVRLYSEGGELFLKAGIVQSLAHQDDVNAPITFMTQVAVVNLTKKTAKVTFEASQTPPRSILPYLL